MPDSLAERWARLEPHLQIARPAGVGPWPAVLLFHGCGGRRAFLADYQRVAAEAGMLAISVDSFAPRGWSRARALATVCTGLDLPGWKRAGDVLAAIWGVSRMHDVDASRVVLAGWSHGGWAIMDLMTMALERSGEAGVGDPDPALLAAVKGLFLAYPYCGPGADPAAAMAPHARGVRPGGRRGPRRAPGPLSARFRRRRKVRRAR
ncbi:MAG: dienelactone hydrolase family protein [Caulobacterales bacterium]